MSDIAPRLLVASEGMADAEVVGHVLRAEFNQIATSIDPDRAVHDFEQQRPQVLVLAFKTLEKAERHYLGLYRLSGMLEATPHHTVLLCHRDELRRAYELCRKRYFDDYVLFWPAGFDPTRLLMAVHLGLRRLSAAQINAQAQRILELETRLGERLEQGRARAEQAAQSVVRAERGIDAALDGFSQRLLGDAPGHAATVTDRPRFLAELARVKADEIDTQLKTVATAVQPMQAWFNAVGAELTPRADAPHERAPASAATRHRVLVVDDDEFQHRLLGHLLADADLDLHFAISGGEALAALRHETPDLILMDIDLPDINGVDVTRRLKSVPRLSGIPVVMITGHSEKSTVVESLKAGAVDYVVKPFEKTVLQAKLRQFLHRG